MPSGSDGDGGDGDGGDGDGGDGDGGDGDGGDSGDSKKGGDNRVYSKRNVLHSANGYHTWWYMLKLP